MHESWEGVVEEVFSTYFLAQLASQTMPEVHEWAEIRIEEVSPADLELLREGAIFYWSIGYRDLPSGQRVRASIIRFRRLPPLSTDSTTSWVNSVSDSWLTSS
ncbi:hypothetical protein [Streptomyces griseoluteus]|uniref:hypothetical protein n=1 Tax=Streptomyces griseoluteus TaxID=29306 RepID=UPI003319FFFC